MNPLVRAGENRRTETPNATMTTLASPSTSGSASLSLWQVEMDNGATGPRHSFDSEQIWSLLEGRLTIAVGDDRHELHPGDTLVIGPDVERQIAAAAPSKILVCGHADAVATAIGEGRPRGTPAWIA